MKPVTLPCQAFDPKEKEALIAAFGLRQVETGLSKTMREDQEVIVKVIKIFAAKRTPTSTGLGLPHLRHIHMV